MGWYEERERCRKRIVEIDAEQRVKRLKEEQEYNELKCELEDDGISADERRCIFCGHGTRIIKAENYILPSLNGFFVYCPQCGAEGPRRETKREAVNSWRREA